MTSLAASAFLVLNTIFAADVVVTAAPPLDSGRLADAMRAYLPEYGIRIHGVASEERVDLRAHFTGGAAGAGTTDQQPIVAFVRAEQTSAARIELTVLGLAKHEAVGASIARPGRAEDLYRAMALKVDALVRSMFAPNAVSSAAPPDAVEPNNGTVIARAAHIPIAAAEPPSPEPPARFSFQTGYATFAFPLHGPSVEGVSLTAMYSPRAWLDVALGGAVLSSVRVQEADVSVVASVIPLTAAVRGRLAGSWYQLLAGPAAQVALARVAASSFAETPVQSATRQAMVALGAETEGRVRLTRSVWVYSRVSALAVLFGQRYTVNDKSVLDLSRLEIAGSVGLGFELR